MNTLKFEQYTGYWMNKRGIKVPVTYHHYSIFSTKKEFDKAALCTKDRVGLSKYWTLHTQIQIIICHRP